MESGAEDRTRPEARYEFRLWFAPGTAPDGVFDGWQRLADQRRQDTYLLPRHRTDVLPKLRGRERLEIKRRLQIDDPVLQRWDVLLSAPFPLDAAARRTVAEVFRPAGEVDASQAEAFLASLEHAARVTVVDVSKYRRRYSSNGLVGEITTVTLPATGTTAVTVAVEAVDDGALRDVLRSAGLPRGLNRDYGAWLRETLSP